MSQSTLSSGHGRSVPMEGVSASCRAWRLPCHLRPYFSSLSSTVPPRSCLSTSKSTRPSVNASGNRAFICSRFSAIRSGERDAETPVVIFFTRSPVSSLRRVVLYRSASGDSCVRSLRLRGSCSAAWRFFRNSASSRFIAARLEICLSRRASASSFAIRASRLRYASIAAALRAAAAAEPGIANSPVTRAAFSA